MREAQPAGARLRCPVCAQKPLGQAGFGYSTCTPEIARRRVYGIRRTEESMISLIWSMISRASDHSRCQTLRP
jgi:hypothetical protein